MRNMPMLGIVLLIPALLLVSLVGCRGDKDKPAADNKTSVGPQGDPVAKKSKLDKPTDAVIKGMVTFKGDAPKPEVHPALKKGDNQDTPVCMKGEEQGMINVQEQTWIIDPKNGIANVVVSLAPPSDKTFNISDKLKEPFKTPVEIDQPFCMYIPHVAAVYADIQPVVFKNTAKVSHSVNVQTNPVFAKVISSGDKFDKTFEKAKDPISVSCSQHNWMSAKILVFDNPYFAVTKTDGSFEIKNVPSDAELTVYVWHEALGKKEAQKFTAKAGENTLNLSLSK